MGKVCMECLISYRNNIVSMNKVDEHSFQQCPARMCNGRIEHIDDEIEFAIKVLNLKGYITTSSCSGHIDSNDAFMHIEFSPRVESVGGAPKGFDMRLIKRKEGMAIRIEKKLFSKKRSFNEELESLVGPISPIEDLNDILSGNIIDGISIRDSMLYKEKVREASDELSRWISELPMYGIEIVTDDYYDVFTEEEEKKEEKKGQLDLEAIKKIAPTGTIKLNKKKDNEEDDEIS